MDDIQAASELVKVARELTAAVDPLPLVVEALNSWKLYDIRLISDFEKKGIVKYDERKDPMTYWVGRTPVKAVGPGRGLYRMKWEVRK